MVLDLWVIIPVAAIWQAIHTLRQRYGLSRIYAKKAGYGSARLDGLVLYAWMAAAIAAVGSSRGTLDLFSRAMLADQGAGAVRVLGTVRSFAP